MQEKLADKVGNRSDQRLVDELRAFLQKHGRLSTKLICPANGLASYTVYKKRFGPMKKVYDLVPYKQPLTFLAVSEAKRSLKLRADVHNGFVAELNAAKVSFAVSRNMFTLFDYGIFGLEVARCARTQRSKTL